MRRIYFILAILCCLGGAVGEASAQIAVVITATVTAGGAGATTPSVNSTGASCGIATLGYHTSTAPTLTDNKGNTWTQFIDTQSSATNSAGSRAYYCCPCTFGSGHTVTTAAHFTLLTVTFLSGTATSSPIDQMAKTTASSGTTPASGTSISPGSITPTVAGTICFVSACNFNGTAPTTPTGYTLIGNCTTATAEAGIGAYKALAGTSAENPSITGMTALNPQTAIIFNVKPPGTPAATSDNDLPSQTW